MGVNTYGLPSIEFTCPWSDREKAEANIPAMMRHPAYPDHRPVSWRPGRRGGGAAEFIVYFAPPSEESD